MLAMGPRDLNSAPDSPVHCSSHSMTSFQSSELTELPVVENSQLFAQRAQRVHSARKAHGTPPYGHLQLDQVDHGGWRGRPAPNHPPPVRGPRPPWNSMGRDGVCVEVGRPKAGRGVGLGCMDFGHFGRVGPSPLAVAPALGRLERTAWASLPEDEGEGIQGGGLSYTLSCTHCTPEADQCVALINLRYSVYCILHIA